jgi:outer membrane protein assembly factor BamB
MRRLVVTALALSACNQGSSVDLPLRAVLEARVQDVVLDDDGSLADAAMSDMICVVDTRAGLVVGDMDLTDGAERILDARDGRALALADGHLHAIDAIELSTSEDLGVQASDARFVDAGWTAIVSDEAGCGVAFGDGAETRAWSLPTGSCGGGVGFSADRASGRTFVADGDALVSIDADGTTSIVEGVSADRAEFDAKSGDVIIGEIGGDLVRAIDADGIVQWAVSVDGNVHDFAVAGDSGLLVISVDQGDLGGEIVVMNSVTGEDVVSHLVPETPDVAVSANGTALALSGSDAVYFYDVDADASAFDTPTTEQVAGLKGTRAGAVMFLGTAAAMVIAD